MTRRARALACLVLLLAPAVALAHSPVKGIGNFYGGLLHPVLIPAHVLLLSALGLLLGQQAPRENQFPLLIFLVFTVTGLVVAGNSNGGKFETVQLLVAGAIGLLVAINPQIPVLLRSLASAITALLIGIDSGQAELVAAPLFAALLGTGLGMCVFLLGAMSIADFCRARPWQKIGIRVIGSWIAASALLVLSLSVSVAK
jgi:hydrogenase/urease accessory protein HupE